jgi:para-aminobenzoate synthetase component 1
MRLTPLPYQPDSTGLFEHIADAPWSVFLDSGRPGATAGRYDILAAEPSATLVTRRGITEISRSGEPGCVSAADPFDLVRELLGPNQPPDQWPFAGGAIGYFAYDLGARQILALADECGAALPDMAVGIYDWALVVDHDLQRSALLANRPIADDTWAALITRFSQPAGAVQRVPFRALSEVSQHFPPADYRRAFERLQGLHPRRRLLPSQPGASAFRRTGRGRPLERLSGNCAVSARRAHAAYLNLPFGQVLSASPERFHRSARAAHPHDQPIKGTRPRGSDPAQRRRPGARPGRRASKDRAENLMIVDLLRNDLGKVCMPGSIDVPRVSSKWKATANVHHLVSTITGRLAHGRRRPLGVLRAAFPGGSITGRAEAPRHGNHRRTRRPSRAASTAAASATSAATVPWTATSPSAP